MRKNIEASTAPEDIVMASQTAKEIGISCDSVVPIPQKCAINLLRKQLELEEEENHGVFVEQSHQILWTEVSVDGLHPDKFKLLNGAVVVPKKPILRSRDQEGKSIFAAHPREIDPDQRCSEHVEQTWKEVNRSVNTLNNPYTPFSGYDETELRRLIYPFKDVVNVVQPGTEIILPMSIRLSPRSTHTHLYRTDQGKEIWFNVWRPRSLQIEAGFDVINPTDSIFNLTLVPPQEDSKAKKLNARLAQT